MSRLISNFGSGLARAGRGIFDRLTGFTTTPALPNKRGTTTSRLVRDAYLVRDLMLEGTVYAQRSPSGYLGDILTTLGKPCGDDAPPIVPYYNPVPAIVGCYQNALGGRLGEELKAERPDGKPLPKATADALARVWRWTNLDARLEELTTLVANQGTAGIRIVGDGEGADGRVYLQFEHPSTIADAEEDSRGNLVNVLLRYQVYFSPSLGDPYVPVDVEELIGKERFSKKVGGDEQLDAEEQVNRLGICPYRLMRHCRRSGDFFGRHAYEGSELAIHGINWALSQLDEATARAINETVFMSGAGDAPQEIPLGRLTAMYVKLAQGVPVGDLKYIVPQLAVAETGESIIRNVELLYTRQPELILNALKLLSGTSGETLAQVLKPVESAVLRARRLYEADLIAALQLAQSIGIVMGLWDLGTGRGTPEAADRAYDDGQGPEAMRFADRPALPPTVYAKIQQAQADVADRKAKMELAAAGAKAGVSHDEQLRLAGYSQADIDRINAEKADQDLLDEEDDTLDGDGG